MLFIRLFLQYESFEQFKNEKLFTDQYQHFMDNARNQKQRKNTKYITNNVLPQPNQQPKTT